MVIGVSLALFAVPARAQSSGCTAVMNASATAVDNEIQYLRTNVRKPQSIGSLTCDDDSSAEWQDWLVDDSSSQEAALAETEETEIRRTALRDALGVLNDRERSIFVGRRLTDEPITLETFADQYGVSTERVRQIEMRAFQKVQKAVKSRVAETDEAHYFPPPPPLARGSATIALN